MTLGGLCESITKRRQYTDEILFSLLQFKEQLKRAEKIEFKNTYITPFYAFPNSRYEIYQYEFWLTESSETFEEHMLKRSGRKSISEVPQNMIMEQRYCYKNNFHRARQAINEWIDFVIENENIKNEIIGICGNYDVSNLYVAFFEECGKPAV